MDYVFEDKYVIIALHELIMQKEDTKGVANCANLDFALYDYEREVYPDIVTKACALMFNIIRGHCFNDGNKRTALLSAATFLMFNGYDLIELPLLYANYLVEVAEKAPNLKDNQVLAYIRKMSKKLSKYVHEDDRMSDIIKNVANELKEQEDVKKESSKRILLFISENLSKKLSNLNKVIERNKYKNS